MDHAGKVKGQFKAACKPPHKKSQNSKPWQRGGNGGGGDRSRNCSKKEVQMLLKRQKDRQEEKEAENNAILQEPMPEDNFDMNALDLEDAKCLDDELDNMLE